MNRSQGEVNWLTDEESIAEGVGAGEQRRAHVLCSTKWALRAITARSSDAASGRHARGTLIDEATITM